MVFFVIHFATFFVASSQCLSLSSNAITHWIPANSNFCVQGSLVSDCENISSAYFFVFCRNAGKLMCWWKKKFTRNWHNLIFSLFLFFSLFDMCGERCEGSYQTRILKPDLELGQQTNKWTQTKGGGEKKNANITCIFTTAEEVSAFFEYFPLTLIVMYHWGGHIWLVLCDWVGGDFVQKLILLSISLCSSTAVVQLKNFLQIVWKR